MLSELVDKSTNCGCPNTIFTRPAAGSVGYDAAMSPRPATLQSSLGYHIHRIDAHMRDRFAVALHAHGVTPSEWAVIASVGRGGCSTAADICEATGRDKAGVARTLARLINAGLVVRVAGADARTKPLALSAEAAALLPRLEACSRHVNQETLTPLDPDERDALARLLARLTDHIDANR